MSDENSAITAENALSKVRWLTRSHPHLLCRSDLTAGSQTADGLREATSLLLPTKRFREKVLF